MMLQSSGSLAALLHKHDVRDRKRGQMRNSGEQSFPRIISRMCPRSRGAPASNLAIKRARVMTRPGMGKPRRLGRRDPASSAPVQGQRALLLGIRRGMDASSGCLIPRPTDTPISPDGFEAVG